ncbi:MAG: class I SAM-dependent methyltransferase, partial [Gemmatimonadaceae bacterium]
DPFHFGSDARPARRFDIVTAFEVLEHSTTPEATLRDMRWFMADDGLMIFSTLLQPQDVTLRPLDWWYVAPRNGHVSLFSCAALDALMRKLGLKWASFNDNTHVAFRRRLPRFAAHFSK